MKDSKLKDFSVRALQKSSSLQGLNGSNRFRENLGTLRNRASVSDEVNKNEPNTYSFQLNRRVNLNVTLNNQEDSNFFDFLGTKKRVQATLFSNGNNRLKATDRVKPGDDDNFRIRLQPGTYSVKITGRSEDDVQYQLKLRTGNNSDDFDDNND